MKKKHAAEGPLRFYIEFAESGGIHWERVLMNWEFEVASTFHGNKNNQSRD